MPQTTFGDVLRNLRRVWAAHEARDLTDAELLQRFLADREDAAFAVLVQRHGPMVLGVCQRVLGDVQGTEDAFQATFLVLVRRAASIRLSEPLGNWLHAVAQRIALRARAQTAGRKMRERQAALMPRTEPLDEVTWQELRSVLDEEIGRLPKKFSAPIVLCYLQGKSYDKAASELGWSKSTLAKRVSRAREMLRLQLVKRGFTLSAGVMATVLCEKVSGATVAALLTLNTVKAVTSLAAGKGVAGAGLSAQALGLAEGAMAASFGFKAKIVLMVLVLGLAGSVGVASYGAMRQQGEQPKAEKKQSPSPKIDMGPLAKKEMAVERGQKVGHFGGQKRATLRVVPKAEQG